jgi:pyruvate ferredoxin oxidoreductase gamma subunit
MIEVRWHGRGGQGAFTVARILGLAASVYEHKFSQAFPSFGPERRGAPVLGFTRISDKKIYDRSEVKECDYIVVLDDTLIDEKTGLGLKEGGLVLVNTVRPEKFSGLSGSKIISIDATTLSLEILGRPITNIAMLGALVAASNIVDAGAVIKAIDYQMGRSIREKNKALFNRAYTITKGSETHG